MARRAARVRRRGGRDPGAAARRRGARDRGRGRRAAAARPGRRGRARAERDRRAAGARRPSRAGDAQTVTAAGRRPAPDPPRWRRAAGRGAAQALLARVERLERRREQLGPVNPLAQEEYAQAVAHVEEMEGRRSGPGDGAARAARGHPRHRPPDPRDLRGDLRGGRAQLRGAGRRRVPGRLGAAAARQRRAAPASGARRAALPRSARATAPARAPRRRDADGAGGEEAEAERGGRRRSCSGVEIEITPAGKSTKRLSLLSGGEKSMTALAFLFAVFLARPCPVLHPRRGRGRARRSQPRPLPRAAAPLLRPRAVHRDHPPEAHDGGRRLAVRRLDGRRRGLEGHLPASAARSAAPAPEVAEVA